MLEAPLTALIRYQNCVAAGFAAFFLVQSYLSANAQSFNCHFAKSADEVLICQDAYLAEQDERLASLYSELRNRLSGAERRDLEREQSAWLNTRRSCGRDRTCIEKKYTSRIYQLVRLGAR